MRILNFCYIKHSIQDFPSYRDKLEVTYRLGRILQMNGQVNKAIEYFEMTIRNGESSEFYFAANSALMLNPAYLEGVERYVKGIGAKGE